MSVILQSSGGGQITIQEPATASNFTQTLPAASGNVVLTDVAGTVALAATGSNIVTASTNGAERIRIDSSGNVGIGNTSPLARLDVTGGDIALNTATQYRTLGFHESGTRRMYLTYDSTANEGSLRAEEAGSILTLGTVGQERMRIDASGNVGIGTAGNAGVRLYAVGADSLSTSWTMYAANSSGTVQFGLRNDNYMLAPSVANYPTTGTAVVINGTYLGYLSSSIRFKKDVVNYDKGLAEVVQLRPVYYRASNPNQDGEYDERTYAGFIAEEVKELGLEEYIDYDQQGEVTSLKYAQMTALLCKAIQEQQALITQLQADVATLKGIA